MKVRVVSDGSPCGTTVFNADTGEEIVLPITAVHFTHHAGDFPRVTLDLIATEVELVGDAELPG